MHLQRDSLQSSLRLFAQCPMPQGAQAGLVAKSAVQHFSHRGHVGRETCCSARLPRAPPLSHCPCPPMTDASIVPCYGGNHVRPTGISKCPWKGQSHSWGGHTWISPNCLSRWSSEAQALDLGSRRHFFLSVSPLLTIFFSSEECSFPNSRHSKLFRSAQNVCCRQ